MAENRSAVPETVQEAERRGTDMWKRNMLWTVLILVAFIVYTAVRGSSTFAVALTEAEVQITYPNKSVTSLPYGEITAVSLLKDADFGECVSGTQQGSGWYGQWHSSEWGDYTLCIHTEPDTALKLDVGQDLYVLSGRTDEETRSFEQALTQLISR